MMTQNAAAIFFVFLFCAVCARGADKFSPEGKHVIETPKGQQIVFWEELKQMLQNSSEVMDKTYLPYNTLRKIPTLQPSLPINCTRQKLVNNLIDLLDIDYIDQTLGELSQFWNRFYTSQYGVKSAEWIASEYQKMISEMPNNSEISVEFFNHTWPQPSVITSIKGVGVLNSDEVVIVGAHLDSVNWDAQNQDISRAPGACDDGSGTVTVMELFRVILQSGITFNRTIEFHHYAAEEVGLLGSQDIANYYAEQQKKVAAYLNFDMDAYPGDPALFNIITDYTDDTLNTFFKQLIENYATIGFTSSDCGYGCSDHASWNQVGYRASFAIENGPYTEAHGPDDKLEFLFLPYLLEYCRVGLGFLVEIGTWGTE